ncbi:MAG: glycosyltransferase family 4 protein [Oscillatoriales cyanobacterium SM2_1_8]|nr:glycosyltransferase family 4 protein [Oscillatoriales cyanobacterium SM2_1_8]
MTTDVFHAVYHRLLTRESFAAKHSSTVLTVHDMIYERYPEVHIYRQEIPWKRQAVLTADWILCVSECTKQDLLTFYPRISPERVEVIYSAAGLQPQVESNSEVVPPHPYFLYVGGRAPTRTLIAWCKPLPG